MKQCGNISFHQDSIFESNQVLDVLFKQDNIPKRNIDSHRYYFSCAVGFIVKVRVKIARVGLVLTFYLGVLFKWEYK